MLRTPIATSSVQTKFHHNTKVYKHFVENHSRDKLTPKVIFDAYRSHDKTVQDQLSKSFDFSHSHFIGSKKAPVSVHHSVARETLNDIVKKCKEERGNSFGPLSQQIKQVGIDMGIQCLEQKMKQAKSLEITKELGTISDNLPEIMEKIYDDFKTQYTSSIDDQALLMKQFEMRNVDQNYQRLLNTNKI